MIENVSVHEVGYAREKEVLLLESLSVPGGTEGVKMLRVRACKNITTHTSRIWCTLSRISENVCPGKYEKRSTNLYHTCERRKELKEKGLGGGNKLRKIDTIRKVPADRAAHRSAHLGASRSRDQSSHRPAGFTRTRLTGGMGCSLERH